MRIRKIIDQVFMFLAWLLACALGLWIILVTRNAFLGLLTRFYVQDSVVLSLRARFFDRLYFVIAGVLYLVFVFFIDGYFRDGLPKNDTVRRLAKTLGLELLVLFPADLVTSLLQRSILGSVSLVLLPLELILGGLLLAYALTKKPEPPSLPQAGG